MHLITKKHHDNPSDNPSNHTPRGSPTAATSTSARHRSHTSGSPFSKSATSPTETSAQEEEGDEAMGVIRKKTGGGEGTRGVSGVKYVCDASRP